MPKRIAFITPAAPVPKREPPTGPQWLHEVRFDGWRMPLHKAGDRVVVFSRNGVDMTSKSGKNLGWIKVKSPAWREANRERSELLQAK